VNEDFNTVGCQILLLNGNLPDEMRLAFENELQKLTVRFASAFQALKYLDNHIQKISAEIASSVQMQKSQEMKLKVQRLLELTQNVKNEIKDLPVNEVVKSKVEEVKENSGNIAEEIIDNLEVIQIRDEKFGQIYEDKKEFPIVNMTMMKKNLVILAKQLTFRNLGSAHFTSLSLELGCSRCETHHLVKSFLSEVGLAVGDYYFEDQVMCSCTLPLSFKVTSPIIFLKSGKKMAFGRFSGCLLLDIPNFDLSFSCPDCEDSGSLLNGTCYVPYMINCKSCFSKGTFQVDGLEFEETKEEENEKNSAGKPLPKNGVCKHFKNSYRWFKFPCCLRMFPCMICHDDNTDHPAQRSELYACGFCSTVQKCSSKNICKKCGGNINGMDSDKRFWEGGKGCRNLDRMSKNDKRKFKKKK
jgi:hypothetical protein